MPLTVFLLLSSLLLTAAQSPSISSEGDPFQPVPAYEGFIVDSGHQINNTADGSSFIAAPGKVAKMDSIVKPSAANPQRSLEDCSKSCAATAGCSAFMYCEAGDGPCPVIFNVVFAERGCGLIMQAESNPNMTMPFMAVKQPTIPTLISGAPITSKQVDNAGPLPGFTQLFAQSFYNKYDYACNGTLIDGACALSGTPESLLSTCNNDPEQCKIMVWYPGGRPDLGPNITFFKGGKGVIVDTSQSNLNHHGNSYVRLGQGLAVVESGGGSGLSDGAIAGIAVGCAVAGAVLAGAAMLFGLKGRHRQSLQLQTNSKNDLELQRPSLGGHSQSSTLMTSSAPSHSHSVSGSTPPGSGSSAARSAAAAAAMEVPSHQQKWAPTVSPFVMAIPGNTARKSDMFDTRTSPFQFPASSSVLDSTTGTTTSNTKPLSSSDEVLRQKQQQQLDSPFQHYTEISILDDNESFHPSTSTDANQYSKSGGRSLDIGTRLEPAASTTASVLNAIKGAGWEHYSVPFESIQWMRHPDGNLWELGHGAFSKVYKCTLDTTLVFAAKVIPLEDANAERVFLREAITLFHLRHPNVVQFSGVCIHENNGILLMELVEGGSLFDNINLRSSNNARVTGWHLEGRRIALGIAQALHYLHHSLKVMHMDLKSANVLLTRDFTPKLADVGFSRVWASMELSAKDSRIGTFAYMAPELLLGGSITTAADIFSLGVLLRELCTGEYPSRGRSRLPEVPHECPQEVVDIIMACMKNEPSERPTAKDVHSMLLKCPH